jgi:hypothetical protein
MKNPKIDIGVRENDQHQLKSSHAPISSNLCPTPHSTKGGQIVYNLQLFKMVTSSSIARSFILK